MASALAALLISTPLSAQSEAPKGDDEAIIVEGQRFEPSTVLRETIDQAGVNPLARFEDKICPGVVGLATEQAERLVGMIRAHMIAFGRKIDKDGCTANATVIFTEQPVEFVKKMAVKQPAYFDFSPAGMKQFTAESRPVVSWHVEEFRDRDGNELGDSRELGMAKARLLDQPAAAGVPMAAKVLRNTGATHLATSSRADMLFGFAVIDGAKLAGKTMEQLAALATMHLLLDIKQTARGSNPGSILSLMDERPQGASPPGGFTEIDKAMINGLYEPRENNRTASQQFSQIVTAIRRSAGRDGQ
jgi:hypothetical protein